MNTTGCAPGWATDESFERVLDASAPRCTSDLAIYWAVTSLIALIRGAAVVRQFQMWVRARARARTNTKRARRRVPLLPLLAGAMWALYVVMMVLVGLNIANATNAASFVLLSLWMLPWSLFNMFSVLHVVRTGDRLIFGGGARVRAGAPSATVPSSTALEKSESEALAKLGRCGASLVVAGTLAFIVSSILMVIVAPIIAVVESPEAEQRFIQAAFALKGLYQTFLIACFMHQVQRCLHVVERRLRDRGLDGVVVTATNDVFLVARTKLRKLHVWGFLSLSGALFFFLCAGRVFPWTWIPLLGFVAGSEAVSTFVLWFFLTRSRKPAPPEQPGPGAVDAATANAAVAVTAATPTSSKAQTTRAMPSAAASVSSTLTVTGPGLVPSSP